jgi:hypothetical protein
MRSRSAGRMRPQAAPSKARRALVTAASTSEASLSGASATVISDAGSTTGR